MYEAADRSERRLGLPVNPTVCSPSRWAEAGDALIQQIKSSPTVPVWDRRSGEPGEAT